LASTGVRAKAGGVGLDQGEHVCWVGEMDPGSSPG
jgi:hypothetical protein